MNANRWVLAGLMTLCTVAASALPVPMADAPTRLRAADTVVVGQVVDAQPVAGAFATRITTWRVARPLGASPAVGVGELLTVSITAPVSSDTALGAWGLLVLNCGGSRRCASVDPHRPSWPAIEAAPARPGDNLFAQVAAELSAVVGADDATLKNAAGLGADSLTTDLLFLMRARAIEQLRTLPHATVRTALTGVHRTAFAPAGVRLALAAAQTQADDFSGLATVAPEMLSDDPRMEQARQFVAYGMTGRVHDDPSLVVPMSEWLHSRDVVVRRMAAYVLGEVTSPEIVRPLLALGVVDADREVRYYAVSGLAAVTHRGVAPAVDLYRADEARYLDPWLAERARRSLH